MLRERNGQGTKVTPFELFFDLVFVFAVTQLAHGLITHFTLAGAGQTLLLWLAVWSAWIYTTWATNFFDPNHPAIRIVLVGVMLASLVMAAMLPEAFGERGLAFAIAFVTIQVGRTAFIAAFTWRHEIGQDFKRILFWFMISGSLWIAGGLLGDQARVGLWILAALCDYAAPWIGYPTPKLGRARTTDWAIDIRHMAERCNLFVILALGESIMITGVSLSGSQLSVSVIAAFATALTCTVALWWIYFDHTTEAATELVAAADDPGRTGRSAYTYAHIVLVVGVIVTAVGNELVLAHPTGHGSLGVVATVLGGPALFIAGHALFKRIIFGGGTAARLAAIGALALLIPVALLVPPLVLAVCATLVIVGVAVWDVRTRRLSGVT